MVKDKINYRARGPNTVLTRQPVQGRANDGGLRIGEMERDGVLAHGMSYFLNESFMIRGERNEYFIAVCNKTGSIAIYNESKNLFLSMFADGPIKFVTNPDGSLNIKNLSRFGRSFSILRIPYALKLLIQELQVMNIQMRLITEENVDQLLNLSYQSQNIEHLLHIEETIPNNEIDAFLSNYKKQLNNKINKIDEDIKNDKKKQDEIIKDNLQQLEPEPEPEPIESEPVSVESNSLEYAPGSPAYIPEFPSNSNSMDSNYYNPNSYNPNNPNPNPNPNQNNSLDFENVNYIKPNNPIQTQTLTHTLTATPEQTQTQTHTLTATPVETHTLTATPQEKNNNDILNVEEPVIKIQTDSDNKTESQDQTQDNSTKKIIVL